jgi:chromosome segregation ATPase
MKRQRLEKEHDRLHGEWDVRNDLLTRLCQALIIETDTNVKFKLEKQIQYEQEQQKQLENRLNEIEQSLNSLNPQVSNQALPLPQRSNAQISSLSSPVSECQYRILDYRNLRDLLYLLRF